MNSSKFLAALMVAIGAVLCIIALAMGAGTASYGYLSMLVDNPVFMLAMLSPPVFLLLVLPIIWAVLAAFSGAVAVFVISHFILIMIPALGPALLAAMLIFQLAAMYTWPVVLLIGGAIVIILGLFILCEDYNTEQKQIPDH